MEGYDFDAKRCFCLVSDREADGSKVKLLYRRDLLAVVRSSKMTGNFYRLVKSLQVVFRQTKFLSIFFVVQTFNKVRPCRMYMHALIITWKVPFLVRNKIFIWVSSLVVEF